MDDAVEQLCGRADSEGTLAHGGERQHGTQAEDVAGRPGLFASRLLGRHEPGRADHEVGAGQRGGVRSTGDPEINDPRAVAGQQYVRGLEVAVDHPLGMDRPEPFRQPRGQRQHGGERQRALAVDGIG